VDNGVTRRLGGDKPRHFKNTTGMAEPKLVVSGLRRIQGEMIL
jgi:hypothetical protein